MPTKTYTANFVWLDVAKDLAAPNGSCQFSVAVRAHSQRRVAELLSQCGGPISVATLRANHGLEADPQPRWPKGGTLYP